eukprot:TRINITY_DN9035_c0_g1_i1.p2 TRINITY_DN9035_c0_g1~~TRINITY_DN9035_c0_g1_i1.p2  ORF type:complete len:309 (+),score=61.79 TRINITY_DN9035_c0_g1_i1:35-961(+)
MAQSGFQWLLALGLLALIDFFTSGGLLLGSMLSTNDNKHQLFKDYAFSCVISDLLVASAARGLILFSVACVFSCASPSPTTTMLLLTVMIMLPFFVIGFGIAKAVSIRPSCIDDDNALIMTMLCLSLAFSFIEGLFCVIIMARSAYCVKPSPRRISIVRTTAIRVDEEPDVNERTPLIRTRADTASSITQRKGLIGLDAPSTPLTQRKGLLGVDESVVDDLVHLPSRGPITVVLPRPDADPPVRKVSVHRRATRRVAPSRMPTSGTAGFLRDTKGRPVVPDERPDETEAESVGRKRMHIVNEMVVTED